MSLRLCLVFFGAALVACDGTDVQELAGEAQNRAEIKGLFFLQSIQPVAGPPGTKVSIRGQNLSRDLKVLLDNEREVDVRRASGEKAMFTIPDDEAGMTNVVIRQGKEEAVVPFTVLQHEGYPLFTGPPENYCAGRKFQTLSGEIKQGRKDCHVSDLSACRNGGAVDCIATDAYPAGDFQKIKPENLVEGEAIAGVSGTMVRAPERCGPETRTDCVTTEAFPAIDRTKELEGHAGEILTGTSILGVEGKMSLPPAGHVLDSVGTYGVGGNGSVGMLSLPDPTYVHESAPSYGVEGELESGSLTLPSAADVDDSVGSYGIDGDSLTASLELPPPCQGDGDTGCVAATGEFVAVDPTTAALDPQNIRIGVTVGGVSGTYAAQSPSRCSADGETGCLTHSDFLAADESIAVPENIKSGVQIAGTVGAYDGGPSITVTKPSSGNHFVTAGSEVTIEFDVFDPADTAGTASLYHRLGSRVGCSSSGISDWNFIESSVTSPYKATAPEPAGANETHYLCAKYTTASGDETVWGLAPGSITVGEPDSPCSQESGVWETAEGGCLNQDLGLVFSSGSALQKHWDEADAACEDLGDSGFGDWRLPTRQEFLDAAGQDLDGHVDFPSPTTKHWTATYGTQSTDECTQTLEYSIAVPSSGDGSSSDECGNTNLHYVCVRDADS